MAGLVCAGLVVGRVVELISLTSPVAFASGEPAWPFADVFRDVTRGLAGAADGSYPNVWTVGELGHSGAEPVLRDVRRSHEDVQVRPSGFVKLEYAQVFDALRDALTSRPLKNHTPGLDEAFGCCIGGWIARMSASESNHGGGATATGQSF